MPADNSRVFPAGRSRNDINEISISGEVAIPKRSRKKEGYGKEPNFDGKPTQSKNRYGEHR